MSFSSIAQLDPKSGYLKLYQRDASCIRPPGSEHKSRGQDLRDETYRS